MARIMDDAVRLGLQEFDFTRGDESYKAELATSVIHNHDARLYFTTPARLRFQALQWLRRIMPRDANGLALSTKCLRWIKRLLGGH